MNGERLLLDSTFIAGLINSRDQLHLKAKDFLPVVETAGEVVITEAVLIEVGNLLHSLQHRQRAAEFIDACYETANVTIVSVDTALLRKAVDFYRLHKGQRLGTNGLHLLRRYERAQPDNSYDRGRPLPTSGLSCAYAGTACLTDDALKDYLPRYGSRMDTPDGSG
jgi:predicted nucleic acid-binding protein